ncbi:MULTISPECIES: amidophosphoribosyltransferase [Cycloclasticus]|jgi:amidophosphoribosyltransferase|uniref:Amidophosphoribosyltransferase n=2 Tax=Cycloclasticus TaxID=34067 RepID=S5TXG5_9GAMM|nr:MULTISPECIES: amidophosphoribosyltransferase [Cycloclasticus]AFT67126.1 Glutamine amidotransferase class-II:Phosphoribosyl transferase [Cycloclasticus sp. P1]AGS39835.1 Amidophosphoribosyltransferase [Cycloclasticus zancles 78-ME]ATI03273.1 amidophosphoribosyltransferase [Cycloclasticus sp. PY97N]EPD12717.1 amidophosphoribosyltransferase [Cycloclasticus pugetii]MBV1899996.1 amidophosphoribosyltransferase [Cycloclasticus sp.]
MCGIAGIVAHHNVNQELYEALTVLQHRGQDAAGIVTCEGSQLHLRKANGLVRDVFRTSHMLELKGNMGIAHVRYPTAGCSSSAEAQPFYVNSPFGITLAHNGNLTNAAALKKELFIEDQRHINTNSDSEILLNVLAHELQSLGKLKLNENDVFKAVEALHKRCEGAYAVVAMITGFGVVGFRDPNGIRPICYGVRETDEGSDYMIASESVAMDAQDFKLIRDIAPGEAVFIKKGGVIHTKQCAENPRLTPCIFEYVYLARPDSIMDNVSVYKSRLRMGEKLAEKIMRTRPDHDIDVVIPIPDTSRTSALQLANMLDVKYREGFIKNRYIGRTFIMPGQLERKKSVRRKLNAIDLEFRGKNVLLVDDSIVRGTTSGQIIKLAREAGAKKVYFASAAPAVRYPNVYGIDMPAVEELVAHDRTTDEVQQAIGADWLIYQELDDLFESVRKRNPEIVDFDAACFNQNYVTGTVSDEYLREQGLSRSDDQKAINDLDPTVIELHNSH